MSDEKIFIARKVANQLFALENTVEQALASAAGFVAGLPEARTQAKLSAVVGQDVFDSAIAMIASLNEARRHMVEMHMRLDETKDQLGLRQVAFGGLMDKPLSSRRSAQISALAA